MTAVVGKKHKGSQEQERTPIEEKNTLKANTVVFIDYLISEGIIEGLVDGGHSILIDGTPLLDDNNLYNFKGVAWIDMLGDPNQGPLPGFNAAATEIGVGVQLKEDVEITKTVNDVNVDAVNIKIRLTSLIKYVTKGTNQGDRVHTKVKHKIAFKPSDGGWTNLPTATIDGKTTSPYERSYHVQLQGTGPWQIRVTRLTADSETQELQNDSFWSGYTEIIEAKFSLPGLAHIGVILDADQFGSQVKRVEFDVRGRVLQVPDNYDPETRTYAGVWEGGFECAWTDNPAWVLYDILTHNVYGVGQYIPPALTDKWLLYEIAKYCDGMVPDGFGGVEPRFTFNADFRDRGDAYIVINELLAAIRAINYWAGGAIRFSQDAPGDSEMIISQADVIDGVFNYENTGLKSRHSIVYVGWRDQVTNEARIEVVEDVELIQQFGIRPLEVRYKGCTTRGQACRYGKWILESEKIENSIVNFAGGFKFAGLLPGMLIDIADPVIANIRYGGRVIDIAGTEVTLDAAVTLDLLNEDYTLTVTQDDLALSVANIVSVTLDVITVEVPLITQPGASWLIAGTDVAPRQFRVLVTAQEDENIFSVTALRHDPTKFDRIELGIDLEESSYSLHETGPLSPPLDLTWDEYLYREGLAIHSAITISWRLSEDYRATLYELDAKRPGEEEWISLTVQSEPLFRFKDTVEGQYMFRVRAMSNIGQRSIWLEGSFNAASLAAPPSDVSDFRSQIIDTMIVLTWSAILDLDFAYYQIRHTTDPAPEWANGVVVEDHVTTTSLTLPVKAGTYLIKAVDLSEVRSVNATLLTTSASQDFFALNIVENVIAEPDFLDVHTSTIYDSGLGALRLETIGNETLASSGSYEIAETVDLIDNFTSRLSVEVFLNGADIFSDIYTIMDIYETENIYGVVGDEYGFSLEVARSNDMMNWSGWATLQGGDYTSRGLKFRAVLTSSVLTVSPLIYSINVQIDMLDRIESKEDVDCPVNGMTFTYTSSFKKRPALAITGQDMMTGDYFVLSNKGAAGFDIEFFDSTTDSILRTYDVLAKGYGYVTDILLDIPDIPVVLTGVIVDLDADEPSSIISSGGDVSEWYDQSGGNNDAIQTTPSDQPGTGVEGNTINGLNTISFDGVDDTLEFGASGNPNLDAFWAAGGTIIFVSQSHSFGGGSIGRIFDKQNLWRLTIESRGSGALELVVVFSGANVVFETPDSSFPLETPALVTITYDASSLTNIPSIYINGVLQTLNAVSIPTGTYSTNTSLLRMGGRHTYDRNIDVDFGKIIFVDHIVSDAVRIGEEQSLATKWGLPYV